MSECGGPRCVGRLQTPDSFTPNVPCAPSALKEIYPSYDTFPDDAQLALLDLIFNLGKGGLRDEWPKLTKSVTDQDWTGAAANSVRPKARPNRNQGTKDLFDAAAAKVAKAKDAGAAAASAP